MEFFVGVRLDYQDADWRYDLPRVLERTAHMSLRNEVIRR